MCTRFDSEVNSHTSTRKLVTTLIFTDHKNLRSIYNALMLRSNAIVGLHNAQKLLLNFVFLCQSKHPLLGHQYSLCSVC